MSISITITEEQIIALRTLFCVQEDYIKRTQADSDRVLAQSGGRERLPYPCESERWGWAELAKLLQRAGCPDPYAFLTVRTVKNAMEVAAQKEAADK